MPRDVRKFAVPLATRVIVLVLVCVCVCVCVCVRVCVCLLLGILIPCKQGLFPLVFHPAAVR